MFMVDLRHRLRDERCDDNANMHTQFDNMHTMHKDFSAMLLGLLPQSYNSYLSAITTPLSVLGKNLTLDALMLSIIDDFNCCTIEIFQSKDKGKDVMFHAERGSKKPWKGGKGSKKSIKCFN